MKLVWEDGTCVYTPAEKLTKKEIRKCLNFALAINCFNLELWHVRNSPQDEKWIIRGIAKLMYEIEIFDKSGKYFFSLKKE